MNAPRIATMLGMLLGLAGCAGGPDSIALLQADEAAVVAASGLGARTHRVLVATTRARDERPGVMFSGERSNDLGFAATSISVPPTHIEGQIEWASQGAGDPRKNFVAAASEYLEGEKAFVAALDREVATRPPGQKRVIVFIHGYNTKFAEGLYRFVQIVDDSRTPSVPVHFSWASRGRIAGYVYDNNSATAARDGLERTLRLIASSKAERVDILAHSMGNWVTVEALRQIRISGNPPNAGKVGSIVLASPDIDIDVFKSQMRRIGKPKRPFFVIVSKDDRALGASSIIAGEKARVGAYKNEDELAALGAVVIDLTDMKSEDSAHHDKFAELAGIGPDLKHVLARGVGGARGAGVEDEAAHDVAKVLSLPIRIIAAPVRAMTQVETER